MPALIQIEKDAYLDLENLSRECLASKIRPLQIYDVAWALSHEGRFSNLAPIRYTVAQHSIWVAEEFMFFHTSDPKQVLGYLLHDAAEAIWRDVSSPAKSLCPEYVACVDKTQDEIYELFDAIKPDSDVLRMLDRKAVEFERQIIWNDKLHFKVLKQREAELNFLNFYKRLHAA